MIEAPYHMIQNNLDPEAVIRAACGSIV
ncbi:hypothetical protein [Sodalis-like endosymbiont of Proechinophthirus fluctus]